MIQDWKEKAFAVQQAYSNNNLSFELKHQQDLTNNLKAALQSIRGQSRQALMNLDDLAKGYVDSETTVVSSFFKHMVEVSENI